MVSGRKYIRAEWINDILKCAVEFVGFVGFGNLTHELCEFVERPLVNQH